jgi:methylmalonyl-CoA mutase cobalamin-binding subunit
LDFAGERGIATRLDPFRPYEGHVWSALEEIRTSGDAYRAISLSLGWLTQGHADRIGLLIDVMADLPDIPLSLVFDDFILGLMIEVGEGWRAGTLRVASEHVVSQVVIEALLRLRSGRTPAAPDDAPVRPLALVGSSEGDQHHIGALCVRVILERLGWRVIYLGPDVPVEEFSGAQLEHGASLVCVSFSPPHTGADVRRAVRILSQFYSEDRPFALALGGSGVLEPSEVLDSSGPFADQGVFQSSAEFIDWVRTLAPEQPEVAGTDTNTGRDG